MKKFALFLFMALLSALPAGAQRLFNSGPGLLFSGPAFVYYNVTSSTNLPGVGTAFHGLTMAPVEVIANGTIVIGFTIQNGLTPTVSDTLGLTWSAAVCTADAGTGNYKTQVWVASIGGSPGATTDTITVAWGTTNSNPIQYVETVFGNLATSSVTNNSKCTASITPTAAGVISGGSYTPTSNNDSNGGNVIWSYTAMCAGTGNAALPTAWTPASGFTPLGGEIGWVGNGSGVNFPDASEYQVQFVQAAVDPFFTAVGETASGDCYNLVSVALKVNDNGSARPATIHVANILHESITSLTAPTSYSSFMPTMGNLRVLTFGWPAGAPGGGAQVVGTVTGSDSCVFNKLGPTSGSGVIFYAQNCAPNPTLVLKITLTGSGITTQGSWRAYDIVNAAASSFQNNVGNAGTCTSGNTASVPNITPTGATSGLAIDAIGIGTGPITSFPAPSGTIFDLLSFANGTDIDMSDNADGLGHYYYNSLAAQNWTVAQTQGTETCDWMAATFN